MKNWLVLILSIMVLGGCTNPTPLQNALLASSISGGWMPLLPEAKQFSRPNTSNQERDEDYKQCVRDLIIAGKDHHYYSDRRIKCMTAMGYSCSTDFETKGDTFYSCTH